MRINKLHHRRALKVGEMKSRNFALTIAVSAALAVSSVVLSSQAADAGTVRYIPDAGLSQLESIDLACIVDGIGKIKIPRGRIIVRNGRAEVSTIPDFQFDRVSVLEGVLLRQTVTPTSGGVNFEGTILVTDGPWMQYLAAPAQLDILATTGGERRGHVLSVNNGQIEFKTVDGQTITFNINEVTEIRSPRTLTYRVNAWSTSRSTPPSIPSTTGSNSSSTLAAQNAPAITSGFSGETGRATLSPYAPGDRITVSNLDELRKDLKRQEDGDMTNGKIAAICTGASLLQLAQAAPLITLSLQSNRFARSVYYKNLQQMTGYQLPNLGTIQSPTGFPTVNPLYPGDAPFSSGPFFAFPTNP